MGGPSAKKANACSEQPNNIYTRVHLDRCHSKISTLVEESV